MSKQTGAAKVVREHLRSFSRRKTFSAPEVARAVGLSQKAVAVVFADFLKGGEIIRIHPGKYFYRGRHDTLGGRGELKPVMLRAMNLLSYSSGGFSADKVSFYSGCTRNYAEKLIRRLVNGGEILAVGRKKDINGNWIRTYRPADPDAFHRKYGVAKTVKEGDSTNEGPERRQRL